MKLRLEMPKPDGTMLEIEMLRSEDWLIHNVALAVESQPVMLAGASEVSDNTETYTIVGPGVPRRPIFGHLTELFLEAAVDGNRAIGLVVELDLPELGLSGPAWIVDLEPSPIIPAGPGQVVTATFKHASASVLDLVLASTPPATLSSQTALSSSPSAPSISPTDTIGVTANHPFWSVDRAEFVQAGELRTGERLQTLAGDIQWVQQKLPRPGPEPVYNLEVHAEHVYYVGSSGVLVHNSYSKTKTPWQRNVYQRSDIDWDLMRSDGLTNLQAARRGYAPLRRNPNTGRWEDTVLHHLNDNPRGGVVEIWRSTHGRFHKRISREANPWRKQRPEWSTAWNNEQSAYWRWRTGAYNPMPTLRLRLPGDS
jgi:hypothetical protein